jgi:GT2 family glycosyltransferase
LIIVDQTDYTADDPIVNKLAELHQSGIINWLRLKQAAIPNAMNQGLLASDADYVLFLDDDIIPVEGLIEEHLTQLGQSDVVATVGQILQPDQKPAELTQTRYGNGFTADLNFPFNATEIRSIHNCMAGNLAVHRRLAIDCGGFDTNFKGVAYRFETEFCRRLLKSSNKLCLFVPNARIHHLKAASGGTRSEVPNFLTSAKPDHSVGEYYFVLRHAKGLTKVWYIAKRFFGAALARYYLRHPWWIPVRLLGELRGLLNALSLVVKGPNFIC